jgi:hypothetical protein
MNFFIFHSFRDLRDEAISFYTYGLPATLKPKPQFPSDPQMLAAWLFPRSCGFEEGGLCAVWGVCGD